MDSRSFLKVSARGGGIVAISVLARYAIGFVAQVAFARYLEPEVFGAIAFASIVAMFFNSLTSLHGDKFAILEKDSPELAVNVSFTMELIASTLFFALVLGFAPILMQHLGKGELTLYVQILACSFFYNPLCRPRCLLERDLSFFRSRLPFFVSHAAAALVSVGLAYLGFGIWSLLIWRLSILFGEVAILWYMAAQWPRFAWNLVVARKLMTFSWPLVGSSFLVFFYYNVDYFIVGQFLPNGQEQLGYYWLGFQAGSYILTARQVLTDVLFPVFSRLEDDAFKARAFERFTHAVAGLILVPTLIAVCFGRELVVFIYSSKWEPAVFPFQVIFITVLMRAISANIGYYLWSRGETGPQFTMAIIFSILLPPAAYYGTVNYGINGTSIAVMLVQLISVIHAFEWYIRPLTRTGFHEYFLWPLSISWVALAVTCLGHELSWPIQYRIGCFAILVAAAYFLVVRGVVCDILAATAMMRRPAPVSPPAPEARA